MGLGASDPIGIADDLQRKYARLERAYRHLPPRERYRIFGIKPPAPKPPALPPEPPKPEPPKIDSAIEITRSSKIKTAIEIARHYNNIQPGAIEGRSRKLRIMEARRMAIMLVVREFSYSHLGRLFKLDHSTIINAEKRHQTAVDVANGAKGNPNFSRRAATCNTVSATKYLERFKQCQDAYAEIFKSHKQPVKIDPEANKLREIAATLHADTKNNKRPPTTAAVIGSIVSAANQLENQHDENPTNDTN